LAVVLAAKVDPILTETDSESSEVGDALSDQGEGGGPAETADFDVVHGGVVFGMVFNPAFMKPA
jgi:hypothetical protein